MRETLAHETELTVSEVSTGMVETDTAHLRCRLYKIVLKRMVIVKVSLMFNWL